MTTYWDVTPRDIWGLVLEYLIPRMRHPEKWPRRYPLTNGSPLEIEALQQKYLVLVAWMESKDKQPVESLVRHYFGESRPWSVKDLAENVYRYFQVWSGVYQLSFLVREGFSSLVRQGYQRAMKFVQRKPSGRLYSSAVCQEQTYLAEYYRSNLIRELGPIMLMTAMESQQIANLELVESLLGDVRPHNLGLQLTPNYSAEVVLWLAQRTNPIYHYSVISYALSRNQERVLDYLIEHASLSLYECVDILMMPGSHNPPDPNPADWAELQVPKYVVRLLARLNSTHEWEYSLIVLKWLASQPAQPLIEEWISAIGSTLVAPQERIHRMITRLIQNEPISRLESPFRWGPRMIYWDPPCLPAHRLSLLRMLYSRFFATFDRPELFYSSYALLLRSDLFGACQSWLQPLIAEALTRGLIRPTRHFP